MKKKELLDIAYKYYPQNIDCLNQTYTKTTEYKNLLEKTTNAKKEYSNNKIIIDALKYTGQDWGKFEDMTYFEWQDRCFTFVFTKKHDDIYLQLKLYQSILVPFYFIDYFKIKTFGNSFEYLKISKEEFLNSNFIVSIEYILQKNNLFEFDSKIINSKIENINFEDIQMREFTYFNAFFNSQNMKK